MGQVYRVCSLGLVALSLLLFGTSASSRPKAGDGQANRSWEVVKDAKNGRVSKMYSYYYNELGERVLDGKSLEFRDDGSIASQSCYRDGVEVGLLTTYHPNGMIATIVSRKASGKRDGTELHWDATGRIEEECCFVMGRMQGLRRIFLRGRIQAIQTYSLGKKHGLELVYWPDSNRISRIIYHVFGMPLHDVTFKADGTRLREVRRLRDGLVMETRYWARGIIREIRNLQNGKLHGMYQRYSDRGELELQGSYDRGLQSGWWRFIVQGQDESERTLYEQGEVVRSETVSRGYVTKRRIYSASQGSYVEELFQEGILVERISFKDDKEISREKFVDGRKE